MKLKYFMRGLGSGIVLTAMVIALTTKPKLTDAEIIKKATELGMVTETKTGLNEDELEDLSKDEASNDEDSNSKDEDSANIKESDGSTTDKTIESKEAESSTDIEDVMDKEDENTNKPDKSQELEKESKEDTDTDNSQSVKTVNIIKGSYSYTVSKLLEDAGIIDSAREFDQYLVKHDFQKRIIPGTYEIEENSSYNQIAELITK